ncbi:BZ3500_MvSof-1268-A1-R1_Chr2-3g05313 [Microbotryum saponariae]|uniref:BZ3500_MvSof-1268-A1-R1_Chr2-3g05313 protein n=1 Tax=Microbotryum saponariae TaxID=289078 RepID=A0A2X0M9X5_9BASI|nr:BZ3500_MvSof-1268-A1-R1_Chr2-3g05313 [Microbotryum saponariae]SDA01176.1 BZ3501_MvSof-1269-A2-R1_Chr2-2g04986 [Microbotryum saponariae]
MVASPVAPLQVAMIGSGEYTTGLTANDAKSDKKIGVVGLTLFDLRRRGIVDKLSIVGTSDKWAQVDEHFAKNIAGAYKDMDCSYEPFPARGASRDPDAYKAAIDALPKGAAITIFTPDSTHHEIALYAIQRGIHVLVTKPACQKLADHIDLINAAKKAGVFVMVEHHKRFDPSYADGKFKATLIGAPNYFSSYMSQPKTQLETFKAWAGRDSDISYYLNSHHIDVHCWYMEGVEGDWAPVKVTASGSGGVATSAPFNCVAGTEDTITLLVEWVSQKDKTQRCTGVYTSSWTAPIGAGVHSEQYFHYMAAKGEIRVNQARRGYNVVTDAEGTKDYNPWYMNYAPDGEGLFQGQHGYGYISIEKFVTACQRVNAGTIDLEHLDRTLPTIKATVLTGAILEAGRRSLDEKRSIEVVHKDGEWALV